jgi:hypothetical protein
MKRCIWVVMAGLMIPALVHASQIGEAQKKLLAKRAAEADCYRKLAERIMGLKITSQTLVRDFVAESDDIQTEVNTFIRGIRLGSPRYYDDGSCEVKGEVSYKKVIATLSEIHTRHYVGNHIKASDFKNMETRNEISVICAVGMGAPRPDTPIEQPDGTVSQPAREPTLSTQNLPSLWKQIGPQGRLLAMRAAELDAYRRLAEQLRGFKITSNTSVKDYIAESDEIATELNSTLRGARTVHVFFHDDEPICEVTLEIPWQKVIATIRDSVTTHINNNHSQESAFRETTTRVEKKYFRATGMGIPPERFMERARRVMKIAPPEWMSKPISATGEGVIDNKGNPAQAKLMATRAAELHAKEKIAKLIGGLTLSNNTQVSSFIAQNDQIRTELDAVIDGAYVKNTVTGTDTVKVTVEIPGARVWKVIADEMQVQEKR